MLDCTLEGFALSQMQIAYVCRNDKVSEADTIEKLVIPVLKQLYSRPLFFERASRASRGSGTRKWDLQYYNTDPTKLKKVQILGLVECKSICEVFSAKIDKSKQWDFGRIIEKYGTVKNYIENIEREKCTERDKKYNVDARGDMLLQVWIYGNCPHFTQRTNKEKVIWTNGETWIVFNDSFFNTGDNPPINIEFERKDKVNDSKDYFNMVEFPDIKCVGGNPSSVEVDNWCLAFYKLKTILDL